MFSPYFQTTDNSFAPLFRLLDDFETYNREVGPRSEGGRRRVAGSSMFTPKFDMRETEENFELHGELPGIEKENISIDFTGSQSLLIKGRVERTYEAGTPPAGYVTGGESSMSGAITEGGEESKSHKTTVEDAGEDGEAATTTAADEGQVTKESKTEQPKKERSRYWYSERSVGEFSRTFNFPTLIDQDGVTASLKDGILNITVPKAKKPASRRVAIQ